MRLKLGDLSQNIPDTPECVYMVDNIRCQLSQNRNLNIYLDCTVEKPQELADRPLKLRFTLSRANAWIAEPILKALGLTEDDTIDDADAEFTQELLSRCKGVVLKSGIALEHSYEYGDRNVIDPPNVVERVGKTDVTEKDEVPF